MPVRYLGAALLALTVLPGISLPGMSLPGMSLPGLGPLATGPARAAAAAAATVPLVQSQGGATLSQVSGSTWTTTVYLDTAALCATPESFDLVTDADTPAAAVRYDGAPAPACDAGGTPADAVTAVGLTFTSPALSAVPLSATLAVTPPAAALAAGDAPLDIALTVRRAVSAAEYVWKPVGCGLGLAALLLAAAGITGVAGAPGGAGPGSRRARAWRAGFWRVPLYASSAWTFGGSWATNFSALGALAGTVLTASGTVAGLVPGVDLGRLGLLFAVAGVFAVIAPQVFMVLNSRFSGAQAVAPAAGGGEVAATDMWIMLTAACLTAFGIGAETGLIGWVLSADLAAGPLWARVVVAVAAFALALLFLVDAVVSIVAMTALSPVPVTAARAQEAAPAPAAPARLRAARPSFLL